MDISPSAVLGMWAAGCALGAAAVARWRIVGPGFLWLLGGVVLLLGIPAALSDGSVIAWLGCGASLGIILTSRRPTRAVVAGVGAALAFLIAAGATTPVLAAVSGAVFLGAVTTEMALGHWYLVDPRLPRWALRRLAVAAAVGCLIDVAVLGGFGVFGWAPGDGPVGVGFLGLVGATLLLLLAVVGALREEGYSGVMAATGLSYLAVLTAIGAAVVGRLLAAGPVLS